MNHSDQKTNDDDRILEGHESHSRREEDEEGSAAGRIVRLAAAAALFVAGFVCGKAGEGASGGGWIPFALLLAAYLTSGYDVILRAARNLLHGRIFDENFLMTISTAGALGIGETEEAAAVMLLYQIGELLSDLAVDRARDSVTALLDLRPDRATVLRNGVPVTVSPDDAAVGETILIRPGERIPLDGTVINGDSRMDTSGVTGESVPRRVTVGGEVLSGCVNGEGVLTVRVTKHESESTAARILRLTEEAAERKAPAERLITRFSRIYTPIVCGIALLIAVIPPLILHSEWRVWLYRGLTALVISCPCALVISVPLTFFSGIGAASRAGVLLKGSNTLETLAAAKVFLFDKTGTVTKGSFEVTKLLPVRDGVSGEELLSAAASAEVMSSHPIAVSIRRAYGKTPVSAESVREIPGCGAEAVVGGSVILCGREEWLRERGIGTEACEEAGTKVWVARDGQFLGCIVIADEIKPGSRTAVDALRRLGAGRIAMLTGDNREAAEAAASAAGIPEVFAGLLPEGKTDVLNRIRSETPAGKIVFVGDGVNDAPVLTAADVGVAMGGLGSDAAMEAADAVLMTDDLPALAKAAEIAGGTVRICRENIVFAVAVKALCILLGALGAVGMEIAVFGDVGVMLLCTANAMRKKAART